MAIKVAVLDPFHPRSMEVIRRAIPGGWDLCIAPDSTQQSREAIMAEADLIFVMAAPLPGSLLEHAPRLRFIQKLGIGVDRIDIDFCTRRRITVARLTASNAVPVAEHTLLLMLAACRRLPVLDRATRTGRWDKEEARGFCRQISGKTVGIVGFGAIGRAVARLLSGFEVDVSYYDPVCATAEEEVSLKVRYIDLDQLIETSDIITLHLPLVSETRNLISRERIARMKDGAVLINSARGGLVDEAALYDALRPGRLFAAGLDAFSAEPPVGNPLLELDETVVTPHIGGATIDNFEAVVRRAVDNAKLFLAGKPLPPADVVVAAGRTEPV